MSDSPFDVVTKYCLEQGKDFPVRNHAFAIFTQKFRNAVENHKDNNQNRIVPKIEEALLQAQLSENELKATVAEAERIIRSMEEEILRPYQTRSHLKEFWFSVLSSFTGSLIFAALMFGLFVLAEDQIRPYAERLLQGKEQAQVELKKPHELPTKSTVVPFDSSVAPDSRIRH